jgi:hypothetical protein
LKTWWIMGFCALVLLLAAPAAAHDVERPRGNLTLDERLAHQREVVRHDRLVLRFFRNHRWLLARYNPYRPSALRELRFHRAQLAWTARELAETQRSIAAREARERAARLRRATPAAAIRAVFGRYWSQAMAVARCESGLSLWAQNGQYLGLFQMGSHERVTYGHGSTALAQARAAHRYFVASGRTWSPWSCKPW